MKVLQSGYNETDIHIQLILLLYNEQFANLALLNYIIYGFIVLNLLKYKLDWKFCCKLIAKVS